MRIKNRFYLLLITLSILTFVVSCDSGNGTPREVSDLEKHDLKGNVKKVTEFDPIYPTIKLVTEFNENGRVTKEYKILDSTGETGLQVYIYAEDGKTLIAIEKHSKQWNGELKIDRREILPSDSSSVVTDDNVKMKYDKNGNLIEKIIYANARRDEFGDKPESVYKYVYDDKNKMTSSETITYQMVIDKEKTDRKNGNIPPSDPKYKIYLNYETFGIVSRECTYNENGDLIKDISKDGNKRLISEREYSYDYDAKNNWTAKYSNGKLLQTRKIVYFDSPEEPDVEDFNQFEAKFYSDKKFQRERIIFPIGVHSDINELGESDDTPYTEKNWKTISKEENSQKVDDSTYKSAWSTDGGACGGELEFRLKDGKWYLVKYNTACM